MKGTTVAAAVAALSGGASAGRLHQRHQHVFERRSAGVADTCEPECSTYYSTFFGEPTLVGLTAGPEVTAVAVPTTVVEEVVVDVVPTAVGEPVPTTDVEICPTPGTYTFPATTITLTETTTVCGASSTQVPAGTHTLGGVTTVVETATTVVCPYATTSIIDDVVTSIIETTTYVCPSAGTYTIAPLVTECAEETIVVLPVVESFTPGTYTRPEVVTTITETSVVIFCPYTEAPVEPTSVPEETPVVVEEPSTTAAPEVEEITTIVVPVAEEEPEVEEPAETTVATPIGGNSGDHYAMTYTPYTAGGQCKSADTIDADIAVIAASGFSTIRVYSTDCDTLPNVGGACSKYGVRMIIGIFVNSAGCTNTSPTLSEQISAIASWAQWNLVEAIVVGNEAIFNGYCTPAQLAGLIGECKSQFSGYGGPYTTAETLNIWERTDVQEAICGAIDITGANIHPYFNSGVSAGDAGDFVAGQLSIVDGICPGKSGLNLECGWPSAGNCNGAACPGADNQALAIASIRQTVGSRTVFFSFHDDDWKADGACGCEKHWGCGQLF